MTATTARSSTELAAAFEQEARRLMEEYKIPGVTLGLLTPDGDHFVNLGVTNLENPLPITEDTIFQIGSTTKTITSLTCSVLVAQGKLDLDVPVRTYLPDFKLKDESVAATLTVRDVLTHQGGFQGDLFEETGNGDDALAKVLDILAESPQVVPLRGHWSYNNAGFYVAGRVIEVLTGKPFETAVTELIFGPLGMDHTLFFPNQVMTYRFTTGHNKIEGEMVIQRPWILPRSSAPAGGTLNSSLRDMTRYARYMMSGTLLAAVYHGAGAEGDATQPAEASPLETLNRAQLWTPQRPIGNAVNAFPGELGQIGQSWFIDQYPEATIISHGGTTHGHQSDFWVSPDRGVGFIAMTNASNGHAYNRKLSNWIKRELLSLSAPEQPDHPVSPEDLSAYEGEYLIIGMPLKISSHAEDGQLTLAIPDTTPGASGTKPAPLRFIGPDRALVTGGGDMDGTGVEFLRGKDGGVEFMRFGARLYPLESQEAAQALPLTAL
ncbi:beta-lactamase family protein [Deinococcus sp. Arct2-2]|uniref:serine hydrolase domain-containing protein n=1 Tax=Deinococcus sp. Arct2-2 TaxID=2568653 RepID=UPI0010A481E3|nr:serine hydrolase domain-containing protein [Deinococcus sp. Arct2-2]THF70199.1 beta-lactamase family protein [Deinococcus sp. Arct2-2]